jgi:predicted lipid-binding transport protein (Tim44 family)
MKTWLLALSMAVAGATFTFIPADADARRLGGGKASGLQRQMPAKPADATPKTPAQPTANPSPANAAPAGAAAAGARSWAGPIAGLAAGLGIAALLSHFGLGEAFANMLTLMLLMLVAFLAIRWLLRRFAGGGVGQSPAGMQYAGAGAQANQDASAWRTDAPMQRSGMPGTGTPAPAVLPAASVGAPAGFDTQAFERIAKTIFIRLQAANDAGQVDDLRKFTTPELFASLRADLLDRGSAAQQTDVMQLDAQVVDTAQQDGDWIVTVRFRGLIREQPEAAAEPFDELWHLVKPVDGSREWAIAGIQPSA